MTLIDKIEIIERQYIHDDQRGWFLKILTGKERGLPYHTGEIYLTCGKPEQQKGGHFHRIAKEWFTVIQGEATLTLYDEQTNEILQINLSAEQPQTIFVPPMVSHTFVNKSKDTDFIVMAYTDQLYDSEDTIMITKKFT